MNLHCQTIPAYLYMRKLKLDCNERLRIDSSKTCSGILGTLRPVLLRQYRSFVPLPLFFYFPSQLTLVHSNESNLVNTLRHAATTSSCNSLSEPPLVTSSLMTWPIFEPTPPEAPPALFPKGHWLYSASSSST